MTSNDPAAKFWNSLGSHSVMMMGLAYAQAGRARPMKAQVLWLDRS